MTQTTHPLLEVQGVIKTYSTRQGPSEVLKNISLTIEKGQIVSLLGINGAGKTTLSSIIATLIPPTAGDVLFNGKSVYANIPDYRMHIGLCPQHPNLNMELTLEENLMYTGMAYRQTQKNARERAHELMETFELSAYAKNTAYVLSGGYKQRFMLARTMMHKPSLIILDEPTVGLDPHVRHQLWDYVKALRDGGTSVLLTTHYIEEAEALSDTVVVLHDGVIKLKDTPEALKAAFDKKTLESVFIELVKTKKTEGV